MHNTQLLHSKNCLGIYIPGNPRVKRLRRFVQKSWKMHRDRTKFKIAPAACITFALAVILLPLNLTAAWIIAVAIHEMCHIIAAKICKVKICYINLGLMGAIISTEAMYNCQKLFCVLSGPIGGLLLIFTISHFPLLAICGCIQSFFNLLPFFHSDGGEILRCILSFWLEEDQAYAVGTIIDKILRIILCIIGLLIAWKLSWFILAVLSIISLLFKSYVKTPCKRVR